jgi:hypothetical protein
LSFGRDPSQNYLLTSSESIHDVNSYLRISDCDSNFEVEISCPWEPYVWPLTRAYVTGMIGDFMTEKTPAAEDLFSAPTGAPLDPKRKEEFHTLVAKGLFLCKRARPNIHTAISVLCT